MLLKKTSNFSKRMIDRLKVRSNIDIKPKFINFSVTKRCNSRCTFCNIWKNKNFETEMTLEQIKRVFTRDKEYLNRVEFVQITGGEPLLREDIVEMVCFICDTLKSLDVIWVITNGLATETIVKKVDEIAKRCKKLAVSTSIEGREELHDRLRGIKGGYKKTVNTLKKLAELRDKKYPWMLVTAGLTLTKANQKEDEIMHVFELTKKYNAGFSIRPVQISPIYYQNLEKSFSVDKKQLKSVKKTFKRILSIEKGGYFSKKEREFYYYGAYNYLREPNKYLLPCYAGSLSFFLTEKGDVYPCVFVDENLGNVNDKTLKQILTSKKAKKVRMNLLNNKCPNCWVECESQRNATYHPEKVFLLRRW